MLTIDEARAALQAREFTDFPECALCGADDAEPFLTVDDGCKLVKCKRCSLVYTSPRFDESWWERFVREEDNSRNVSFTENRLAHGVALRRNVASQPEDWRAHVTKKSQIVLDDLRSVMKRPLTSLHDVGCGVGFLISDARDAGLEVSGNELNGYAVKVMCERLGLDARVGSLHEVGLASESRDAVTMTDYIEHTYHPLRDFQEAFRITRPGGGLFVHTFRIDCRKFEEKGAAWDMLRWNHVYHFSTQTLTAMITAAGFEPATIIAGPRRNDIKIIAVKPL
jgi:SAM-dependent methyltransferase